MVGRGSRRSRSICGFLNREHPSLAAIVAKEIVDKVHVLSTHPQLGRPIAGRKEYRQIVLQVLGAAYVFQYRFDGNRLVMLRVFHARETRA
jgi:plasmid stabilization system protein ParE